MMRMRWWRWRPVTYLVLVVALAHVPRLARSAYASSVYTLLTQQQTECELEALTAGTLLADRYNSHDEGTEWDVRIHNDYLTEHLGFAGWIQMGTYKSGGKTAHGDDAKKLHRRGGWAGQKHYNTSAYWALENQWLYMMGDSTQRQIWATFVSPFQNNDFEGAAKEWTRENCARQFPHRRKHPAPGVFPEEGWSGRCGNNEVTCDLPGFGNEGKITFDWKHFSYEDYDEVIAHTSHHAPASFTDVAG